MTGSFTAVASRAPDERAPAMFARHSVGAVATEPELHSALLPELGISPDVIETAEPAPVNLAYTSYMLAVIHGGSYAERDAVHRHFRVASRYEWMFWDMGYRQESWPV